MCGSANGGDGGPSGRVCYPARAGSSAWAAEASCPPEALAKGDGEGGWVLSLPRPIRYILARDAKLLTRALRIFVSEIFTNLRRRAGVRKRDALVGAVTRVQRSGGALNLMHSLSFTGPRRAIRHGSVDGSSELQKGLPAVSGGHESDALGGSPSHPEIPEKEGVRRGGSRGQRRGRRAGACGR